MIDLGNALKSARRAKRHVPGLGVAALIAGAVSGGAAQADPTELVFDIFIPRQAPLAHAGLVPWAEEVSAASGGTLSITVPSASLSPVPDP